MKFTILKPKPAPSTVQIELNAEEAAVFHAMFMNVGGSGPREFTSRLCRELERTGHDAHNGTTVEYKGQKWTLQSSMHWKRVHDEHC